MTTFSRSGKYFKLRHSGITEATEEDLKRIRFRLCAYRDSRPIGFALQASFCCDCGAELFFDPTTGPMHARHICVRCMTGRLERKDYD